MCETRALFARSGLRCTKHRLDLYEALLSSTRHPTAEELHRQVRHDRSELSLATVYNALEVFCLRGLCRKLPSSVGAARYDADLSDHLHVTTCGGEIRDVPTDLGARMLDALPGHLLRELEQRMDVRVQRIGIDLMAEPNREPEPAQS